MKKIILTAFILLASITVFCQQPYHLDLSHLATIDFPDTPKMTLTGTTKVYNSAQNDIIYMATATPLNSWLSVFGKTFKKSIYAGVIKGSLKEANGKLIYQKNITIDGVDAIEFAYKATFDSTSFYCYHQAVSFKNNVIFYGYWSRNPLQQDDKGMRSFFGSFKLANSGKDPSKSFGVDPGKLGLDVLIGAAILAAGIGLIFLIRKLTGGKRT